MRSPPPTRRISEYLQIYSYELQGQVIRLALLVFSCLWNWQKSESFRLKSGVKTGKIAIFLQYIP